MDKYCMFCGSPLIGNKCSNRECKGIAPKDIIYCPQCGEVNNADSDFCSSCGSEILVIISPEYNGPTDTDDDVIIVDEQTTSNKTADTNTKTKEGGKTSPQKLQVSFALPWLSDQIEWNVEALRKAGYTSAKRGEMQGYYILTKEGAESLLSRAILKQRGLANSVGGQMSEGGKKSDDGGRGPSKEEYGAPWPSDEIEWNVEALRKAGYTSVRRGKEQGRYLLTTKEGAESSLSRAILKQRGLAQGIVKRPSENKLERDVPPKGDLVDKGGPYCIPWPSDNIEWNEERLARSPIIKIKRGVCPGLYILTRRNGVELTYDCEKVKKVGFAQVLGFEK